jgi:hypothetical protein
LKLLVFQPVCICYIDCATMAPTLGMSNAYWKLW